MIDGSVTPGADSIVGSSEKLRRWLFQNDNRLEATAVFCLHWTGALAMLKTACLGDEPAERRVLIPQMIVERASTAAWTGRDGGTGSFQARGSGR